MSVIATPAFEGSGASAQEEAYQHILYAIRMGTMRPGDRLVPEEIASSIGMSRMPVREALRRLTSEGLVTMRPNRGAVVRELSEKEVIEVFEIRAVLEGLAAYRAAQNVTDRDLLDLQDLLMRMQRAEPYFPEWITAHRLYHERFCAISDSPRLMQQIAALHSTVEPLMRIWLENRANAARVQQVHEELNRILAQKKPALMEQHMREHIRRTATGITEAMRQGQSSGA